MDRIPLYTDIDNLVGIFNLDRTSALYSGMKQMISKESTLIINELEEDAIQNSMYPHIAQEISAGDYIVEFRSEEDNFLAPPFKTNLQDKFKHKSSVFFSNDNVRVTEFRSKNGILMAGIGEEKEVYNKLNFERESCKAFRFLIQGESLLNYSCFDPYILPFSEIVINEPYLFLPDRADWDVNNYIKNNFEPLMKSLFKNVKNKVNIIICTFVNDDDRVKLKFPFYDPQQETADRKGFAPLYELCNTFFKDLLGGARFNLWLVISPMARKARHDRYILTNYQYIESASGFSLFDDHGNFENRGEKIEFFSVLDDQTRKELMPSVTQKLQNISINQTIASNPNRVFGLEHGNSHFFTFS